MKAFAKKFKKTIKNERGQGMLEYVLILALVLVLAGVFKDKIKTAIDGLTGKVGSDISSFSGQ